jgi:soluble P-type ATPase
VPNLPSMPRPSTFNSMVGTTVLSEFCAGTMAEGNTGGHRSDAACVAGVEEARHEHEMKGEMTLCKIIRGYRKYNESVLMVCTRATTDRALRRKDLGRVKAEAS